MTTDELLAGESACVEYKRERPSNAKAYLKTVVAFANVRGGTIVFGVDDKTREVVGVPDDQVFLDMDAIANAIADAVRPQILPEIALRSVQGKSLIVVDVPMGRQCPYYLASGGLERGAYVRVGATTRHADIEWIRELVQECAPGGFDREVQRGATASEEDIEHLCDRMYEVALSRAPEDLRQNVRKVTKSQLLTWGVLVDRDGEVLPTNAFRALTGDPTLVKPLQCAIFKDESRAVFLDRRDFAGDVMQQIESAYQYVLEKMNMGADLGGVVRRDVYELPTWAVREIITNAVLHRSYVERSSVQVALYSDRLEVSSPGGIVRGFTLERALSGESKPRNEALAQAFLYMRLIEGWGSGIVRVKQEFAQRGMRTPEFVDLDGMLRVNLWRPSSEAFAAYLRGETASADGGEKKAASDRELTASDRPPIGSDRPQKAADRPPTASDRAPKTSDRNAKASDREQKISDKPPTASDRQAKTSDRNALLVAYLCEHDFGTVSEFAQLFNLSKSRTRAVLSQLAEQGLIHKVSDKRYARYVLADGDQGTSQDPK